MGSRRRLACLTAAMLITLVLATPVAAADRTSTGAPPPAGEPPPVPPTLPDGDAFKGPARVRHSGTDCSPGMVCAQHSDGSWHYHYVGSLRRAYDGYLDRWLTGTFVGKQTASYGAQTQYGNAWGASIGFDAKPISGKVGYDVSWSSSEWWSSSFAVPSGTKYRFRQRTWYYVRVHTGWTETCLNWLCSEKHVLWGEAWGGRTFAREYQWVRVT